HELVVCSHTKTVAQGSTALIALIRSRRSSMNKRPSSPDGLTRERLRDKKIVSAMEQIPRSQFVPVEYKERANDDCALPIGYEQTISQPFIVALMIQEACINAESKVLEVGTGSGYQTAILSYLGAKVYTIEIIPE